MFDNEPTDPPRSGTILIRMPVEAGYVVTIDGIEYAAFSDATALCTWLLHTLKSVEPVRLPKVLSSDSDSEPAPDHPPRGKITRLFGK